MATLEDLLGKRILTGVGESTGKIVDYCGDEVNSDRISFILDGVTYTAIEDPSDGYRSAMKELIVGGEVKNTFPPCEVLCRKAPDNEYVKNDALQMIDTTTGKVVLTVGTQNFDDYYPSFWAEFNPGHMAINQVKP